MQLLPIWRDYRDLFFQGHYLFLADLLTISRFQRTLTFTLAITLKIVIIFQIKICYEQFQTY